MRRWTGLLAAAMVVIAIPAFAYGQPERVPGSIVAFDFGFENPADGTPLVTVNPGETVTFSYPQGSSFHNVHFTEKQPTSCTLNAGGSGPVPPLPAAPTGKGWSGTCTFNAEGTYEFVCDAHSGMLGAVLVVPVNPTPTPTTSASPMPTASASPTPTPTSSPQPTPSPTATVSQSATASPTPAASAAATPQSAPSTQSTAPPPALTSAGPAASRLVLVRAQRGPTVKGSIAVSQTGSRLLVEVLAKRKRVGRTSRSVDAGTASFRVTLNAGAKRTLQRARKLSVTVRITVTPPSGAAFTTTRIVSLRR